MFDRLAGALVIEADQTSYVRQKKGLSVWEKTLILWQILTVGMCVYVCVCGGGGGIEL